MNVKTSIQKASSRETVNDGLDSLVTWLAKELTAAANSSADRLIRITTRYAKDADAQYTYFGQLASSAAETVVQSNKLLQAAGVGYPKLHSEFMPVRFISLVLCLWGNTFLRFTITV
jgi:hypothetical protein